MKKLRNILIALISVLPLICSAQTEEEMKWRWYTLIESDITYKSEVEDICEDLLVDKNNFIFTEWKYSKEKPEDKEFREIEELSEDISYDRNEVSYFKVNSFGRFIQEISELEFYDSDNNILNYKIFESTDNLEDLKALNDKNYDTYVTTNTFSKIFIEFERAINIKDLKIVMKYKDNNPDFKGLDFQTYLTPDIFTNAYAPHSTNNSIICNDGICTLESKVKEEQVYENNIIIKTSIYKYRDRKYKCFKEERLYIPGYHVYVENFIKDEEDFIIEKEEIITNEPIISYPFLENYKGNLPDSFLNESISLNNEDNSLLESKKEENENKQISMVTNSKENNKKDNNYKVYIFVILLAIFLSIPVIIKKVRNSRTK